MFEKGTAWPEPALGKFVIVEYELEARAVLNDGRNNRINLGHYSVVLPFFDSITTERWTMRIEHEDPLGEHVSNRVEVPTGSKSVWAKLQFRWQDPNIILQLDERSDSFGQLIVRRLAVVG